MKTLIASLGLIVLIVGQSHALGRGVNLSGWLQGDRVERMNLVRYDRSDFANIKALGCDTIRLPIDFFNALEGPQFRIHPLLLQFVDKAVSWAEDVGLDLILDNHSFDPLGPTKASDQAKLVAVWDQISKRYAKQGKKIYYELLNEPHGIDAQIWDSMAEAAVKAIRANDREHFIVIGGVGYNSVEGLTKLKDFGESKLIYTFHFYDPFLFTHQGASWTDPSMEKLSGVRFPPPSNFKLDLDPTLKGTWIDSNLQNSYLHDAQVATMKNTISKAVDFAKTRKAPIFCGEFGVYQMHALEPDRSTWYKSVRSLFDEFKIPWTIWDYDDSFGFFKKGGRGYFPGDLDQPVIEALGLGLAKNYQAPSHQVGRFYDKGPSKFFETQIWPSTSTSSPFAPAISIGGGYSLKIEALEQYGSVQFNMRENFGLQKTSIANRSLIIGYSYPKGDQTLQLRFVDSNQDGKLPWRMAYNLKPLASTKVQTLKIPLEDFKETGAWDGQWHKAQGDFDWTQVVSFELVAEEGPFSGPLYVEVLGVE